MSLTRPQRIVLWFMVALVALWIALFATHTTEGFYNYLFSFLFGLTPLIGGAVAMFSSKTWGGLKTPIGKAVFFVGLGVFCWGIGELIWSYYNFFLHVAAPYPSFADIGFAPSIFFYSLGAFYLSRVTGAQFALRDKKRAKIWAIAAVIAVFLLSWWVLVVFARGGVLIPEGETALKIVLDIAYPLGDFVGLAVAVVVSGLSFRYMGGKFTPDILAIWAGLLVMYVADTMFSYTTTLGTYYNANFGDLLLATGTFLLTFGVLGFYKAKDEGREW